MPKATIESASQAVEAPVTALASEGAVIIRLSLSQLTPDPITDVRMSPSKDEAVKVEDLARSMYEQGQLQPIVVRTNGSEGKYLIVAGRRRFAAAQLIEQKTSEPWLVDAMVRELDDDAAWRAAVQENLQRRQFSPIEFANNIAELKKRKAWDGEDWTKHAADYLNVSRATISQTMKLLGLASSIQKQIHSGSMSVQAALRLPGVSPSKQEATIQRAEQLADEEAEAKKASARPLSKKAQAKAEANPAPEATPKIKEKHVLAAIREVAKGEANAVKPRTRGEIVEFFTQVASEAAYPESMVKFADTFISKWVRGEVSDRVLLNRWNAVSAIVEAAQNKKGKGKFRLL